VFGTPDLVRLTDDCDAKIRAILAALVLVGTSDAPIEQIEAQLDALVQELQHVVATEFVPIDGSRATPSPEEPATAAREETSATNPEPPVSPSPEASASPSPQPTASPSPQASASPSPQPTALPSPQASDSPSPQPTASPSPEPTPSPIPEPTATPTP
jgi:hypothetical protein